MQTSVTRLALLISVAAAAFFVASPAEASRCSSSYWSVSCSYKSTHVQARPGIYRDVRYQVPEGTPPAGGWPTVIIYQGSFFPVEFSRSRFDPFGGYWEAQVIRKLLDNGFAVVAPDAGIDFAWETNFPVIYELTADYSFINNLLAAIQAGTFGPLNWQKKYATGISSGGYNTSRMAVTFNGDSTFKALVVASGSYATCTNVLCIVPSLPSNHPPTYFLHGWLDLVVPWWTMDLYYDRLQSQGIATGRYTNYTASHEWFSAAPDKAKAWFAGHL